MKKISTIAAAIATSLVLATTLSACGGAKDDKVSDDQSGVVAEQSADEKQSDEKQSDEEQSFEEQSEDAN